MEPMLYPIFSDEAALKLAAAELEALAAPVVVPVPAVVPALAGVMEGVVVTPKPLEVEVLEEIGTDEPAFEDVVLVEAVVSACLVDDEADVTLPCSPMEKVPVLE